MLNIVLIIKKWHQRDNILKELRELNSDLGELNQQPVFQVPGGYFG